MVFNFIRRATLKWEFAVDICNSKHWDFRFWNYTFGDTSVGKMKLPTIKTYWTAPIPLLRHLLCSYYITTHNLRAKRSFESQPVQRRGVYQNSRVIKGNHHALSPSNFTPPSPSLCIGFSPERCLLTFTKKRTTYTRTIPPPLFPFVTIMVGKYQADLYCVNVCWCPN